ncbi:MAG: DUF6273 domain-containing protein [Roseburia sp.]|nr:DUF6273 domain-containing protein [Roseburia sp.]MCM1280173.1 DUF6273 domain-containing protein [Robinsoniella sp.]
MAAIDDAIEKAGTTTDADTDVEVNGTKYRRISGNDTNNSEYFDEVENNGYRYFKWEPIKWKVLQNDGSTLFVIADKAIDCKDYNDEEVSATWETSTIRNWLNNSFYHAAFSSSEQGAIVEQIVVNEDNPEYGTEGGNDTNDKVYLLSIREVKNEVYGFCSDDGIYSMSRGVKTSDYANARGVERERSSAYEGNCRWWLRSSGYESYSAATVDDYGWVSRSGFSVCYYSNGVCPALHISLSSGIWSMVDAGAGSEGGNGGEYAPTNPVHFCCAYKEDSTDFSYVYFGSYPQSEVTDSEIVAAIDKAISVSDNSVDVGMDVWLNGIKYRRIGKNDTNGDNFDDVSNNSYRYFKWEPIKWKVLQNDGNTLFVIADKAIDCKDYNDEYASAPWQTSTIREWLNDSFYGIAFSSDEQGAIVAQDVVNEDNPDYGIEGGNSTSDKIYLLSAGDVADETYGFCSDCDNKSMSRRVKASDYANARGTLRSSSYGGSCWWWLRSPGGSGKYAAYVYNTGLVDRNGCRVNKPDGGVCPALHINLSSDIWFMVDDGNSSEGGNGDGSEEEKILTGLQATKTKTEYIQGEQLNLDDLTVTAVYGESREALLAGYYTTNAGSIPMNTPGKYALEIFYTEKGITKKAEITITVKEKSGGSTQQPDSSSTQPPEGSKPQQGDNTQNQPVKVTRLTITAPSGKLAVGKKIRLVVKAEPENAANKTVTWKSSNTKYATVDKDGKVTLKEKGAGKSITITATANDGSGKKATVKLKIMKHAVKSIKLKAPKRTLKTGKSMTIKATVKTTGSNANKTLKWTSSNTKYATVKSGKVTAKKAGKGKTVTITAAATDGSGKKAKVKIKIQ